MQHAPGVRVRECFGDLFQQAGHAFDVRPVAIPVRLLPRERVIGALLARDGRQDLGRRPGHGA